MKIQNVLKIGFYITAMLLVMIYGMLAHRFELPPYPLLKVAYTAIGGSKSEVVPPAKQYFKSDIAALISIKKPKDVALAKERLITFLWGDKTLPLISLSTIDLDFKDSRYHDISSLKTINKLTIEMEFGLKSHVYHFFPKRPNNKLVLYHQGHKGDFYVSKKQITELINNGYSVLAFSMPLLGLNNQPVVQLARLGKLKLTRHDHMRFLSPEKGHPIKYFLEPVIAAINHIEKSYSYTSISMLGISGGGWTSTLVSAIDNRITKSFSVAGSYPIYLRALSGRDWGDFEQHSPELYNTVNYLELYVMSAYGTGRKHLQVLNKYDACCYSGTMWKTYTDITRQLVFKLGAGEFDFYSDDSHREHMISDIVMDLILDELNNTNNETNQGTSD